MQRRFLHVRLPHPGIDRLRAARPELRDRPIALAAPCGRRRVVSVCDAAAARAGIHPDQPLAHARALQQGIVFASLDPAADIRFLTRLAQDCRRFTPLVGLDPAVAAGEGGLYLDVTGCCHLFHGEEGLLDALRTTLQARRLSARLALADTPGAAWAWSSAGAPASPILPPGTARRKLRPLPVQALRLPTATATQLEQVGIASIGALADLPRPSVAARFGQSAADRLDQAFGHAAEPLDFLPWRPPLAAETNFSPALATREGLQASVRHLVRRVAGRLQAERLAARRLRLTAHRLDGSRERIEVGTSKPGRNPAHLDSLFAPGVERLDPGIGIERLRLCATHIEAFNEAAQALGLPGAAPADKPAEGFAALIDRLCNRLGRRSVVWPVLQATHAPREQLRPVPAAEHPNGVPPFPDWPEMPERPLRLFSRPEPLRPAEPCPAGARRPPNAFVWRGRLWKIAQAGEAERIAAPWWRETEERGCDRFRVEDVEGRRFWIARNEADGAWTVEGLFG